MHPNSLNLDIGVSLVDTFETLPQHTVCAACKRWLLRHFWLCGICDVVSRKRRRVQPNAGVVSKPAPSQPHRRCANKASKRCIAKLQAWRMPDGSAVPWMATSAQELRDKYPPLATKWASMFPLMSDKKKPTRRRRAGGSRTQAASGASVVPVQSRGASSPSLRLLREPQRLRIQKVRACAFHAQFSRC